MQKNKLRILSLGAGVQSTTLALMVKHGDLPMVDCAVFADTGWEPKAVYAHLDWLESVLPFTVHRVMEGNIREDLEAAHKGKRWLSIPAFSKGGGMVRRQCTKEYKIVPIRRKVRELAGLTRKKSPAFPVVEQWIGISMDEAIRMKPSQEAWQENIWPLIDKGMTRRDCLKWLEERQYSVPPKSACIGCPYNSDARWAERRENTPEEFAEAVAIDKMIRSGVRGMTAKLYLHRSMKPLDEVKFTADERGQPDLFNNECKGMCGV